MAVTSTEQERYCPWQVMLSTDRMSLDTELIVRDVHAYQHEVELDGDKPSTLQHALRYGLIRMNGAYRNMDPIGVALSLNLRPGHRHFRGREFGHWMPMVAHVLDGELIIRADRAIEFELDPTKELWPQFLDVFQSEEFVRDMESQVLDLVQRVGRYRMEWELTH